jgi:hypothetical protein
MRKVPILTVIGMLALFATSASAGTCTAQDGPDVVLGLGEAGDAAAIDLSDFLCGDATPSGAIDASGVPAGGDAAGASDYSATDGSATVSGVVQISDFVIGNAPDPANGMVGASGNPFINGVAPGGSISSVVALTNLPEGPVSPDGQTGAALLTSVAQVTLQDCDGCGDCCVMRARSADLVDDSGLTPVLNADGSYSVEASADFTGAYVVTLGARAGDSADAVHLVAAQAVGVSVADADVMTVQAGDAAASVANGVVSAGAGQGILVVSNTPVAVGGLCTVSLNYNTDSTDVNIAVIGFDGGLDGSVVNYSNPTGGNLEAGVTKTISISFASQSGSVLAGFQVYNGGTAAATVTISDLQVVMAGPVTDYALDVNASVDMGDSYVADVAGSGAAAGTADGCNISLEGVGGHANTALMASVPAGCYAIECNVQRTGDADAGAVFVLTLVDGAATSAASFVPGASIPTDSAIKVTCSVDINMDTTGILVVQSAGANVTVSNLCVRAYADAAAWADLDLLP